MIVTFATPKYKAWLDLAMEAYHNSNPNGEAKIYLINFGEHSYKDNSLTKYTEMNLDFPSLVNGGKVEALMRMKLTVVLYELILNNKNLFWIDSDIMIMKDLTPLLNKLDTCDLLVLKRPQDTTPDHRKVAAGAFGVSPRAIPALAKWSKLSWSCDSNWWSDQISLGRMAEEVNSVSLTEDEFSLKGNPEAAMFHRGGKDYELCKSFVRGEYANSIK